MLCENLKGDVWKKVSESILTPLYPFPAPTHTHTHTQPLLTLFKGLITEHHSKTQED